MTKQYLIINNLLTLGLHLLLCVHARVVPVTILNKNCPAGCIDHGNCNGETGICECRFGFGGPDCSRRIMPACHSTPDLASSIPGYGHWFPKNCFCHKQLLEAGCSRAAYRDPFLCNYYQFWDWKNNVCYVLKDVPEDQQFSIPPDGPNDPRYKWKRGLFNQTLSEQDLDPFHFEDTSPPDPYELPTKDVLVPLEKCPGRCSGRGWCVKEVARDDVFGCRCHGFYKGVSCDTPRNEHCYLNCSGRGTCSGGFCHCQSPYWGLGCARSKAYVSDTWLPHPTKLKIYVYDLPERIAYKKPWHDEPALLDTMYLAEVAFMDQLLSDWSTRTENPWEANLFVLNTYTIYYTGNIGFPAKHFANVFSYVRNNFPFWNMTGGRNHVAIATNDRGCCDIYKMARLNPDLQHPIKMVHFGQVGRFSRGHGSSDPALEAAFREFKRLAAHQAGEGTVGEEGGDGNEGETMTLQDLPGEVVRFRGIPSYTLESIRMEREPCFRPEQDVAIPNYLERGWLDHVRKAYGWDSSGRPIHNPTQREYLFYFNGYSKSDMSYSGGVRQGLLSMYSNLSRPDVAINKGCCTAEFMLKSRFCLSPLGYGWGIRLSQAMHTGCVPILVQDHVYSAFWDVLPYEKFAVRINRHNLHRLFDILDAITPEQLAELQQGLADHHRYFVWHGDAGGLAYNATLTSLHRRLLNMWMALFRGST
ncbi:hypothetical protein VaNZ11_009332 [Volvox africanus]|uniref:EGF-like domain-containing protein n=1 Tax=Volvox africanus TaxID=51714 RepID=A0ABQ5S8G9_9CHLO|nr:hypothetical protein VaNZ11_009332 [Volvox africanus]